MARGSLLRLIAAVVGPLALFMVLTPAVPQAQGRGGPPAPSGPQGLPALQARVQALEEAVADVSAALSALGVDVQGLQQLFSDVNAALSTAQLDIRTLQARVEALEDVVAEVGGGLTSYDQLAGLPCTTAQGGTGTVNLVGLLKSPVCAAGLSANGRFIDVGTVVIDRQTNLVWEKKDQAGGLHDVDNTYNFCEASGSNTASCYLNTTSWISQVNAEVFAGISNWRVPTRDELLTILDVSAGPPRIDPIFGPTQAALYWSSTASNFGLGWGVYFNFGVASDAWTNLKFHVRAVRTGP